MVYRREIGMLSGAFNQVEAVVGTFSVIVKTDNESDGSSAALAVTHLASQPRSHRPAAPGRGGDGPAESV